MGKKRKCKSAPASVVESTLNDEVADVVQEQVKNQNVSALAEGFAQSAAFFGKKTSYASAVIEHEAEALEEKIDDKTKKILNESKVSKMQKAKKSKKVPDLKKLTSNEISGEEKTPTIFIKKKKSKKKNTSKTVVETEEDTEVEFEDLKACRTVFVGNVSLDATPKDIKAHFSACGKVENVRLRYLPIAGCAIDQAGNQKLMMKVCAMKKILSTAKDNCNAYVTFAEENSVAAALKLNGTTLVHKKIRVDLSDPVLDARRSIFIGNVPFKCSDDQMLQFFQKRLKSEEEPEPIDNVRLIRDRESGLGKGFGYLLLRTPAVVAKALALQNLKMENRELRVQVCGKRFKNMRGEESSREKFEGLRASAGARARIHLKRKLKTNGVESGIATKKIKRAAAGKKPKPKHAARKKAKAAAAAATGNILKKHQPDGIKVKKLVHTRQK
ncbi:hypothetical protein CCR75_008085 [Bremia lactucae]|uniref:RRM domain-containing protein n=1 Tax=Bremia lactucae TaxID=4779 RepID=A0A976IKE5_BRELC|nr:hypothetical protein CCR75_008085 [Bremia lactucae]